MSDLVHDHPPMTHTHGLQPDCARCQQYVERPTDLDATNLNRIWRGDLKTTLDVKAFDALYRAVVITQRLSEAVAWRDFDPEVESIAEHTPHPKPDQFTLFEFGGRS